jgi:hypothetical protein
VVDVVVASATSTSSCVKRFSQPTALYISACDAPIFRHLPAVCAFPDPSPRPRYEYATTNVIESVEEYFEECNEQFKRSHLLHQLYVFLDVARRQHREKTDNQVLRGLQSVFNGI